jgi:four helix bundle protein
MRFEALEVSLEVIRSLRQILEILRTRDPDLHRQIRKAASSVALNAAEGNCRSGKDRLYHFRIASGSAEEVRASLRVAEAWGDLGEAAIAEPLRLLDRLLRMLWGLSHSTPRARSVDW